MFRTFYAYLQTQQGEFPLTPRSSCCLLPLTLPIATLEEIANGGVIIAIATTGLVIGLGVILVVKKNLSFTQQIPQIMPEQILSKENLEKLEKSLLLSLSNSDEVEEFYREIASSSIFSIDRIREETIYNEIKISNLIQQKDTLYLKNIEKAKSYKEVLEKELDFWDDLGDSIIQALPLISSKFTEPLKELAEETIIIHSQLVNSKLFQNNSRFLKKWLYSKDEKDLIRSHLLAKEITEVCYKVIEAIKIRKDMRQYSWNNYTEKEKKQLFGELLILGEKSVERYPDLAETYQNLVLSFRQSTNQQNQQLKVSDNELEEQIKIREQFKPPFPPKDDRTPEEVKEQIRKNQKLIEHYRKRLTERGTETPEEIEQGKKAFERLQQIIRESR